MTTVETTPKSTSNVRSGRTARTLGGLSLAAATAFAPMAGVVDAAPPALLQQEEGGATEGAPPVELGDRNELAAWWQDRLNEWLLLSGSDLYPIVVDGWYGPNTQEATIAFQESTDAVEADGVVDPEDRVALREAIESLGGDTDDGTDDTDGFGTASVTSDDFPASGDVSLLQDVSVEEATDQEATDRLVFEFGADTGDLSYEVEYTDTLVDTAGTAVEVEGDAMLAVRMTPASTVDLTGAEAAPTYTGPDRFSPDTASAVTELALAEDFEAAMTWAVGVDQQRPFRVQVMENPLRLVVDVRSV